MNGHREAGIALVFFVGGLLLGLLLGCRLGKISVMAGGTVTRTDTVVRTDTLARTLPSATDTVFIRTKRVKAAVSLPSTTDTLVLRDSVMVDLPITQQVYSDTSYTAWVSGYLPRLDSIAIYRPVTTITTTIREKPPNKRWGIGIQAGYGVSTEGRFAPYLGVGITYNLWRF